MTRRALWAVRAVFTLSYVGAITAWYLWFFAVAPDMAVWVRIGLFLATGVVWWLADEVRAVWRAAPKPDAKTWAQWQAELDQRFRQREGGS